MESNKYNNPQQRNPQGPQNPQGPRNPSERPGQGQQTPGRDPNRGDRR